MFRKKLAWLAKDEFFLNWKTSYFQLLKRPVHGDIFSFFLNQKKNPKLSKGLKIVLYFGIFSSF